MSTLQLQKRDPNISAKELRKQGFVPGVFYGGNVNNTPVMTTKVDLQKHIHASGAINKVSEGKKDFDAKFDDIQLHPVTHEVLHFSLIHLPKGEHVLELPLVFEGNASGVKEGGIFVSQRETIKVSGMLKHMPEHIVVDISNLNIGDNIHFDDIKLPNNLTLSDEGSLTVASCQAPKQLKEVEEPTSLNEPEAISEDNEKTEEDLAS